MEFWILEQLLEGDQHPQAMACSTTNLQTEGPSCPTVCWLLSHRVFLRQVLHMRELQGLDQSLGKHHEHHHYDLLKARRCFRVSTGVQAQCIFQGELSEYQLWTSDDVLCFLDNYFICKQNERLLLSKQLDLLILSQVSPVLCPCTAGPARRPHLND